MAESQLSLHYEARKHDGPFSAEMIAATLKEARKTIDDLREQNILMRKILAMIDSYNNPEEYNSGCAWCGVSFTEINSDHEDSCIIVSIRILLPTIPEIDPK